MKLFVTLALVQIAGILGTAIAQEQRENYNSRLMHQLRAALNRLDAEKYESPYFDITEPVRSKCETNGGPKAPGTALEGARSYTNSISTQKNVTMVQLEAIVNQPNIGPNAVVEPICQFVTSMNDVSKAFTDSLRVCWTQPERNSMDLMNNVTVAVSQFMCENGGSRISALFENDELPCLYSKFENGGIERCAHMNFVGNVSPIESYDRTISPPWSVPVIVPKTENCIEFKNFQQCIVAAVQGCATSRLLREMNALFIILNESTGCKSLLDAYASPVTDTN